MKPSPNAKPVSQDLEYAFFLLWRIGRVYDQSGFYVRERRFKKAKFPTRDTKPTEQECRAALARILMSGKIPTHLLRELAAAIHPEEAFLYDTDRRIKFEKMTQGHHDAHRDNTIVAEVAAAREQGKSHDEACVEVAGLAGISFERVRDICQKRKAFLDSLEEGIRKRSDAGIR
jgi:hypothetical protein